MTIPSTPRRSAVVIGTGVIAPVPFTFKVGAETDIQVQQLSALNVTTTLVLNSDYTVALNADQSATPGGTVTPLAALPVDSRTVVLGDVSYSQPFQVPNAGSYKAELHEGSFDRIVTQIQQLAEISERTVKVAAASDIVADDLVEELLNAGATAAAAALAAAQSAVDAAQEALDAAQDAADAAVSEVNAAASAAAASAAAVVQVNLLKTDLADLVDLAKGSALVAYKAAFTGAVGRTLADRLGDTVSAKDFGLKTTNTGAQNVAAMALAVAYATAQGGLTLHIPRGTYDFDSSVSLAGADNLRITGDGIEATVLRINHATADFITAGGDSYQTIDNLTLTSSVTRTAGAMFKATGFWRRGLFFRVKIEKHFDGVDLFQFELCTLMETNIVTPTGNGTALIVGNPAATNQGAALNLHTVFIRGNDENFAFNPTVGRWGMRIYDVEAVVGYNVDLSIFTDQCVVIEPTFQTANCFFTSCYFDATVAGDNILVKGAGIKNRFQFSNCWFASAGRYETGAPNAAGVQFQNVGSYIDWKFTGCEFVGTSGPGLIVSTPQADITLSGCSFNNCGTDTTLTTSIYVVPGAAQTQAMVISGCKFIPFGTSTSDLHFVNTNCTGNIITGCELPRGIAYAGGASFGSAMGNSAPNTSDSIASAATLQVNPVKNFYTITGTTNVGGLFRTYTGHTVTFVATGVFTWQNGGALALAGGANFVTAAGSTLTLICQPSGNVWREVSRHT